MVFQASDLAEAILDAIDQITDLELLGTLAEAGLTLAGVSGTTSNRRQQAINQSALIELVRGGAAVSLAQRVTQTGFTDRTSAVEARDRVGIAIDDRSDQADTNTFRALRTLRATVTEYITEVSRELPQVITSQPAAIVPSLALAYDVYDDLAEAGNIAARNRLPRPGFVPAQPLELLQ